MSGMVGRTYLDPGDRLSGRRTPPEPVTVHAAWRSPSRACPPAACPLWLRWRTGPRTAPRNVVRWYRTLQAATHNQPTLSASRDGVMIHGQVYLHTIPVEWIAAANRAFRRLQTDRGADVSGVATHRRRGLAGPLEPVAGEAVGGAGRG